MDLVTLAKQCVESINQANENGFAPTMKLHIKHGRTETRYPFGRPGPAGQVIQWNIPHGMDVCKFDPLDVLAFLVSAGAVRVAENPSNNGRFEIMEPHPAEASA